MLKSLKCLALVSIALISACEMATNSPASEIPSESYDPGPPLFTSIDAGEWHAIAIRSDGTLWAWGSNVNGELGVGDFINRFQPAQIGMESDWSFVAAGSNHSLGIKENGTLWSWGDNFFRQLGVDGINSSPRPTQVGTDTDWIRIDTTSHTNIGLKTDGSIWTWGYNYYGQVGNNSTENQYTPIEIGTEESWIDISAGYSHTVAININNRLWSWGGGYYGQLGNGSTTWQSLSPSLMNSESDWNKVSAGKEHTIALKQDGSLWCWGNNSQGQLGNGVFTSDFHPIYETEPINICPYYTWVDIDAGYKTSMARRNDLRIFAWGDNTFGQIGNRVYENQLTPFMLDMYSVNSFAAGTSFSTAITDEMNLWTWGSNNRGQLGDGSGDPFNYPIEVQM